jgi:iron-sulfur cluster repair protein YtfE (RIC family)
MNALVLLMKDHKAVASLFEQVKATESEEKHWQLFEQIRTELETHTHIEETIFYPRIRQYEDLKDIVLEGLEEHKQVKTLIREIGNLVESSEKLDAKLKVMGENVEHHVDEEENEMFPKVRKVMTNMELEELGAQLEAAKNEYAKAARASAGK